jgi:hypothetical protein
MAKTWILRTETKGTGAQMVPLETATERSTSAEPVLVLRKTGRVAKPQDEAAAKVPRRFRIVDVMTRRPLLEDGSPREAVAVLRDVRSIVDIDVYVWLAERDRWQRLTFAEQRAMLDVAAALPQG